MKKTKHINLDAMRKRARYFALAPIALAVLVGCSDSEPEQVKFVTTVDECKDQTGLSVEQCEAAYKKAVTKAQTEMPRYNNANECGQYYGECRKSDSGDFFVPLMAGYIAASMMDDLGRSYRSSYYNNHTYNRERPSTTTVINNNYPQPSTKSYSTNTSSSATSAHKKPTPTATKTVDRGGFGTTAKAKSSWGSSGSKSSGWGG